MGLSESRSRFRLPVLAAVLTLLLMGVVVTDSQDAVATDGNCTEHSVSVSLTDDGPVNQTIVGDLCMPLFGTPETVQLLVHGGTYDRTYWNFAYKPYLYSYVKYANATGYATFAVDSIGTGESSHPVSSQVTMQTAATALHQVITALRAGSIGSVAYENVIWVGHSLGTSIGWAEVNKYLDVDAFIATGAPHGNSATSAGVVLNAAVPASTDPKFSGLGLDSGYLAFPEQTREDVFYYLPTSEGAAIDADNATRSTVSASTLGTGIPLFLVAAANSPTLGITVPVLSIFGTEDFLFCQPDANDCDSYSSVEATESAYYSNASSFQLVLVPATGHSLNMHATAPLTFVTMLGWALTHVAP